MSQCFSLIVPTYANGLRASLWIFMISVQRNNLSIIYDYQLKISWILSPRLPIYKLEGQIKAWNLLSATTKDYKSKYVIFVLYYCFHSCWYSHWPIFVCQFWLMEFNWKFNTKIHHRLIDGIVFLNFYYKAPTNEPITSPTIDAWFTNSYMQVIGKYVTQSSWLDERGRSVEFLSSGAIEWFRKVDNSGRMC